MQAPRSREIERQETEKWKEKRKHERRIGNFITCTAQIMRDIFVLDLFFRRTPGHRSPASSPLAPLLYILHPLGEDALLPSGVRLTSELVFLAHGHLFVRGPSWSRTRQVHSRDGRTTPLLAWFWLLLSFPFYDSLYASRWFALPRVRPGSIPSVHTDLADASSLDPACLSSIT